MDLEEILVKIKAYEMMIDSIMSRLSDYIRGCYSYSDIECVEAIVGHVAEMKSLVDSMAKLRDQLYLQEQVNQMGVTYTTPVSPDITTQIDELDMQEYSINDYVFEDEIEEASEYQGKKVTLNKPFRTPDGPKKFSVYVKNDTGNIVKVNFGDPNMEIKRDDPERRANYRARHNCSNPGPKWKANYWSCKMWSEKPVTDILNSKANIQQELSKYDIHLSPYTDYLFVPDKTKKSSWKLRVKKNGIPDMVLMGAAWAALHEGYRGNKVILPPGEREKMIKKLTALYHKMKKQTPLERKQ